MEFELENYLGPKEENHGLMQNVYERAVQVSLSPSHDIYHIQSTIHYAWKLFAFLDESSNMDTPLSWERIFIACCLHDLGRNRPTLHTTDSIDESLAQARILLVSLGVQETEIELILRIIEQHDQPELDADSLEALILKEADFLAGMGATGILRTILWAGESGRNINDIIFALNEKMPARITSLQLKSSRRIAAKLWPRTRVFLSQFQEELYGVEVETYPGQLIIFEGISGSGKGTQAHLLKETLEGIGRDVAILSEPTNLFRKTLQQWKHSLGEVNALQRKHLLIADRAATTERIRELLRKNFTVILDRSFISTMVYQGQNLLSMADILNSHSFFPTPDLVVLFDISSSIALERITSDLDTGQRAENGDYEQADFLEAHRQGYLQALKLLSPSIPVHIIDASQEKATIQRQIADFI